MSERTSGNENGFSRRALLGYGIAGLVGGTVLPWRSILKAAEASTPSSQVFLRRTISSSDVLDVFRLISKPVSGRVLVTLDIGNPANRNLLPPVLVRDLCERVGGTLGASNAEGDGPRAQTQSHRDLAKARGFDFAPYDVLDAEGSVVLPVEGGRHLQGALMGSHVQNYDSIIVFSHFTGDAMAGFSGAIKNLATGLASQEGKGVLYGDKRGKRDEAQTRSFLERLAEYAKGISDARKDRVVYINVLGNLSAASDNDPDAPPPIMPDIGIVASTDSVAVDSASFDMVMNAARPVENELVQRMKDPYGYRQIDCGSEIKLGTSYSLVEI